MNTNNYLNSIVSLFLIFTTCAFTAPAIADNVVKEVAPMGFTTGKSKPADFYMSTNPSLPIGTKGNLSYSALLSQAVGLNLPAGMTLSVNYEYDASTAKQQTWWIWMSDSTAVNGPNRVGSIYMWSNKPTGFANPSDSANINFGDGSSCIATTSEQIAILAKAFFRRLPVSVVLVPNTYIYDKIQGTMVLMGIACKEVSIVN